MIKQGEIIENGVFTDAIQQAESLLKVIVALEKDYQTLLKASKQKLKLFDPNELKAIKPMLDEMAKAGKLIDDLNGLTKKRLSLEQEINALKNDDRYKAEQVAMAKLREEKKQLTAQIKLEAQANTTQAGSIEALRLQTRELIKERNKLDLSTEQGKRRLQELNRIIDKNTDEIKENVSAYERQKMGIGGYAKGVLEALNQFFGVDTSRISQVVDSLSTFGQKAGGGMQRIGFQFANTTQQATGTATAVGGITAQANQASQAVSVLQTRLARLQTQQAQRPRTSTQPPVGFQLPPTTPDPVQPTIPTGRRLANPRAIRQQTLPNILPANAVATASNLNGALGQTPTLLTKISGAVANVGRAMMSFLATPIGAVIGVFGALFALVAANRKTIIEFNASLTDLQSITGATGETLEFLKKRAIELGSETKGGAKAVLEAYKLIASAKPELLDNAKALDQVTQSAITLSQASGLELNDAATRLTDALNQFGLSAEESARAINVLAAGSKFGAAEIPQVTEALLKFGATAKGTNVSLEESVALIETLAEKGLKGAEAGTAIRNVLLKISAPDALPKEAVGTMNKLGISLGKLKDNSIPVAQKLESLKPLLKDTSDLVKVFGVENVNAARNILENTDRLQELTKQVTGTNTAYEQATINNQKLERVIETLGTKWDSFILSMEDGSGVFAQIAGVAVRGLINVLEYLTDFINDVSNYWNAMVETLSGSEGEISTFGSIVKGVFDIIGKAISIFFESFKEAVKLIIKAVAVDIPNAFNTMQAYVSSAFNYIKTALQPTIDFISSIFNTIKGWVNDFIEFVDDSYTSIKTSVNKFFEPFISAGEKASSFFDGIIDGIDSVINYLSEKASEIKKGLQKAFGFDKMFAENDAILKKAEQENIARAKKFNDALGKSEETQTKSQEQLQKEAQDKKDKEAKEKEQAQASEQNKQKQKQAKDEAKQRAKQLEEQRKRLAELNEKLRREEEDARTQNIQEDQAREIKIQEIAFERAKKDKEKEYSDIKDKKLLNSLLFELEKEHLKKIADIKQKYNDIERKRLEALNNLTKELNSERIKYELQQTEAFYKDLLDNTPYDINKNIYDILQKRLAIIKDYYKSLRDVSDFEFQQELIKIEEDTNKEFEALYGEGYDSQVTDAKKQEVLQERITQAKERHNQKLLDLEKDYNKANEQENKDATDNAEKQRQDIEDKRKETEEWLLEQKKKKEDAEKQLYDNLNAIGDAFIEREQARLQKKLDLIDKEIQASKDRQAQLTELAKTGIEDATNNLAFEQRKQAELEIKREKAIQRQKFVELGLNALKTYTSKLENKDKTPLGSTIKDITLLTAFIRTLPAFYKGTEDTGQGGNIDEKGGYLAVLHPHERVLTAEQNRMIGGIDNDTLAQIGQAYRFNILQPMQQNTVTHAKIDSNEIRKAIIDGIKSADFPIQSIQYDQVERLVTETVKTKNKVVRNHRVWKQ